MAKRGALVKIDEAELERLCALQCTDEEIGAWFNVTTRTIERRRKNPRFAEIMTRGKAKGRISVRRQQMKLLEKGNATMGVWLGKQLLGQVDQVDHRVGELPRVIKVISIPKIGEICPPTVPVRPLPPSVFVDNPRGRYPHYAQIAGSGEERDGSE